RGEPEEPQLAVAAQPLHRRYGFAEDLRNAVGLAAAGLRDLIMQVQDVDPLETQPLQAGVERPRHRVADAAEVVGLQPHFGAAQRVGGLELLPDGAEVLFRFAFPVLPRRVEIVDAGRDRACDGALLVARVAAYHQPADRAAAEAQHRELQSGASERAHLHLGFLSVWSVARVERSETRGGPGASTQYRISLRSIR